MVLGSDFLQVLRYLGVDLPPSREGQAFVGDVSDHPVAEAELSRRSRIILEEVSID